MSEAMPPAHSAPATLGPANSPPSTASTGSSSDNSDSESSSRASGSCSEDGPLPVLPQDSLSDDPVAVEATSAEKGAQRIVSVGNLYLMWDSDCSHSIECGANFQSRSSAYYCATTAQ